MTPTPAGGRSGRLRDVLEPVVAGFGADLEDVTSQAAGKRRLLRVVVDADGGVSLDEVAELSQAISARLDESDAMGGAPYVLEVTSPGIDRPLTAERHWRRAIGRLVKARLADGTEVTGRVAAADGHEAVLSVAGDARPVRYAEVARATVQVEFAKPAPGEAEDEAQDDEDGVDEGTDGGSGGER